jgi:undecaprenyl-phosphate 4-deoxy-4-formamido-L-arabinose transferase
MSVGSLSAVVPVYNSAGVLPELARQLEPVLRELADEYELVLVNDGSADDSWAAIEALAGAHAWIRGIDLMRNAGQHNALLCGIRAARGELIVTLDDDLQNPPSEIPSLIEELEAKELDVVYGTPRKEQHGVLRDLASQITKLALQSAMGASVARKVSAFRVFRTRLRESFAGYQNPFVSIDVLLTWGTTRFGAVVVRHEPRAEGESNYTFRKLVTHAINMMTGFSTFPLQLASLVGFGCTLLGLALLIYVLARTLLEGGAPAGFPFLASMIALFSGAQLFALGILGEYLARMHMRTMDRPPYVVRSGTGDDGR